MNELIKYIADILGVDISSELAVLDMREDIEGIQDFNRYRKFIRSNVNYYGMDYLTGLQKFIKLTSMYKDTISREENKDRLANGNKFALELSEKVKAVEATILNAIVPEGVKDIDYKNLTIDDKAFFTAYEEKTLRKIGSLRSVVNLRRSESGNDPLYCKILEITQKEILLPNKQKSIENGSKIQLPNIKRI